MDTEQVVISDVTDLGMSMPDGSRLTHYVQFVIQNSADGVVWHDECAVEVWAGPNQVVVRDDLGGVKVARNINSIVLDLTAETPMPFYRLFPGAPVE